MDPTNIVEDTERTRFCPQTDRRIRWKQYTPLSTSLKREGGWVGGWVGGGGGGGGGGGWGGGGGGGGGGGYDK